MIRETQLFCRSIQEEDRSVLDFLDADLHVRQRTPGAALRDRGRLGRRLPPGLAGRHAPRRRPDPGEHHGGDLQPDPDLAGQAGQVDPREHAGHAARAAAFGRGGAQGRSGGRIGAHAPRADGAAPERPELRVVPRTDGPAGLRPGELRRDRGLAQRRGRAGDRCDGPAPDRSRVPGGRRAAGRAPVPSGCVRPLPRREDAHLCDWAAASAAPIVAPSIRSSLGSRRTDTASRPWCSPSSRASLSASRSRPEAHYEPNFKDLPQDRPEGPGRLDRPADARGNGARTALCRNGGGCRCAVARGVRLRPQRRSHARLDAPDCLGRGPRPAADPRAAPRRSRTMSSS